MYLNVVQLAESFGVAEKTVEGWIRDEGLPCVPDRGRLLFDRGQVAEWAAARGLGAKAGFLSAPQSAAGQRPALVRMLSVGGIWRHVAVAELMSVVEQVIQRLPAAPAPVRDLLSRRARMPDGVTWAPIGAGLALPHLRSPAALGRESGLLALIFLREPLPLPEPPPDGRPVRQLLFFIAPSPRAHLDLLACLSRGLTRGTLRDPVVREAPDAEIVAALEAAAGEPETGRGPQ